MSELALRVDTEPLGGGALTQALLADRLPAPLRLPRPSEAGEWRTQVHRVRDDRATREWLTRLLPALAPSGAARERLERVAREGGVVVTTGQQPGLFGGPIYTWSKAFSALALADELERLTSVPAAPIFWAATDDADFAEAGMTHVAVPGGVETLHGPQLAPEGTIMARAPLGDVSEALGVLARGAGAARHVQALEIAREAYDARQTIGGAYVALLRRFLEPLGIAVLDAAHEATRRAADAPLRHALAHAAAIDRALAARNAELRAAGFEPQVAEVSGLSLVFDGVPAVKRRIRLAEAPRAAEQAVQGSLGANVLLRPVIERRLLPTAAYVAGPGELAYFAQVGAVADALGFERPVAVPRWSGGIREPHVERILERLGLTEDDLRDPHAAETRLVRAELPASVRSALESLRAEASRASVTLATSPDATGLVPAPVAEGLRRQIAHRITRVERRFLAALKRREAATLHDVATARASLWPLGARQERTLNFLPFLARHGEQLVTLMLERAREHARGLVGSSAPGSTERTGQAASA